MAKDSQKHWRSAGGRRAWWGWVSKPWACRVSAPRHRPPCRSVAPPPAAWPHSSSTAPAPGRATGAARLGAGTPPARGRGRGSRSRHPHGPRGPRQGPSPRRAGQAQGGFLGRQRLSSVCFSSPRRREGLWGPGAPRGRQERPWLAGSGPAAALPRRMRGAVASSWAPGPAWQPWGFALVKPVPWWGSPPPWLSAAPSQWQPHHADWGQVPRAGGHGPGPLPPCASHTQGVCWGGIEGSASTSEKTAWAASASIFCGQPTGDKGPIYPELLWCRWRPGWQSSAGFLPRCPMPSHWMRRAEFPMKILYPPSDKPRQTCETRRADLRAGSLGSNSTKQMEGGWGDMSIFSATQTSCPSAHLHAGKLPTEPPRARCPPPRTAAPARTGTGTGSRTPASPASNLISA